MKAKKSTKSKKQKLEKIFGSHVSLETSPKTTVDEENLPALVEDLQNQIGKLRQRLDGLERDSNPRIGGSP